MWHEKCSLKVTWYCKAHKRKVKRANIVWVMMRMGSLTWMEEIFFFLDEKARTPFFYWAHLREKVRGELLKDVTFPKFNTELFYSLEVRESWFLEGRQTWRRGEIIFERKCEIIQLYKGLNENYRSDPRGKKSSREESDGWKEEENLRCFFSQVGVYYLCDGAVIERVWNFCSFNWNIFDNNNT